MNNFDLFVCLLPAVFMVHDFEEIIGMKTWLGKHKEYLITRFPFLARMLPRMSKLNTQGFAVAVLEEFILLCLITYSAIYFQFYYLWLAVFLAFSLHLLMHIIQWIIVKKYIPAIITTFLVLPYSVYGICRIFTNNLFSVKELIWCGIAGLIIMVVNLMFAHWLAGEYMKYQ